MTEINGHIADDLDELQELVKRDAQCAEAREPSIQVQETTAPSELPFDQKAHDLMLKSIDQVTTDWVGQLARERQNSKSIEQQVMERAAKTKADITALYLLGAAAQAKSRRDAEFNAQIVSELDKLQEQRP